MTSNFDKTAFASLLKKAIGTRKQAEFAEAAGISKEHLSRFINQRLDAAPSAETLNRIAQQTTAVSISDFYAADRLGGARQTQTQSVYLSLLDHRLCQYDDDDEAVPLAVVPVFQFYAVRPEVIAGLHSYAGAGRRILLVCFYPELQAAGIQNAAKSDQRDRDFDSHVFYAESQL